MKFTGSYKKSATEPVFGQLFLPTTSIRLHLTKNGLMLFEKAKGLIENLRNLLIVRTLCTDVSGLPNFPRAMAIRVKALENKNEMV